jgi:acetyl-CoA synthetase
MQDRYAELYNNFRWHVPERFNIAQVCSTRWATHPQHARRVAIYTEHEEGTRGQLTYAALQSQADRLSHALSRLGVKRGDRVAIVMPQRAETAIAHIAVYQLGAVAMPLSMLFGPEALQYRLQDSAAVVAICDETSLSNLLAIREQCPSVRSVIAVGSAQGRGDADWSTLLGGASPQPFTGVDTHADDAAVLIYTSGTTGPPKGALIPHRALIGNLTGFVASQNWLGFDPYVGASDDDPLPTGKGGRGMGGQDPGPLAQSAGDQIFWSPADWAWTGGLMDALLPSLYFGVPIVGYQGRFSAGKAFDLMQRYGVTHTFLFPTALKQMMKAYPQPREQFKLKLQAIMSAGEAVGDAVFAYGSQALGVTINEMFGQTEINYIVGNCARMWPARAGSMGRAYPGHRVAVIDDQGRELPPGEPGDVAVNRYDIHGHADPVFFLGYWNNEAATNKKYTGDWCRTGDVAVRDVDGYLWYQGRSDDVFKVSGYRVGPSEIENCLVKHPAVALAAIVPKPDAEKGNVVKAYIVLQAGVEGTAELELSIQQHVRGQLAPYEYPREIVFVSALPMTTTGKIQRKVLRDLM